MCNTKHNQSNNNDAIRQKTLYDGYEVCMECTCEQKGGQKDDVMLQ